MGLDIDAAIGRLAADPGTTGLFTDFDGSLSEIVRRPDDAAPLKGAVDVLEDLARRYRLVAVVSGRSLEDLRTRFAPRGVVLAGSYGRERSDRRGVRRATEGWEPVSIAAAAAVERLPGVVLERKGAGVALHFREAPEHADAVREAAEALAGTFELEVRPGRQVVELTAPGPGKGEAIERMVAEHRLRAALYAGDDVADVEAFERLRELDVDAVCVAVVSDESPDELAAAADLAVDGPHRYLELLRSLRDR